MQAKEIIFLKKFGSHVKKLRISRLLSLKELAIKCRFDKCKICKIESGKANITVSTLLELARGIGIPPSMLMNFETKRTATVPILDAKGKLILRNA